MPNPIYDAELDAADGHEIPTSGAPLLTREAEDFRAQRDVLLEALQLLFERANRNTIDPFALQHAARAIAFVTN